MTKRSPSSQWFADDIIPSLNRIRGGDQYNARGLAQYDFIQWAPTIGKDALDTRYRTSTATLINTDAPPSP